MLAKKQRKQSPFINSNNIANNRTFSQVPQRADNSSKKLLKPFAPFVGTICVAFWHRGAKTGVTVAAV
jgi:hypothetical protein